MNRQSRISRTSGFNYIKMLRKYKENDLQVFG